MRTHLRIALGMITLLTLLTGVLYPYAVTALAKVLFPRQAEGSLIVVPGKGVRGSEWIGQAYDDPKWFWGRPSATSPAANAALSSGSNKGPLNPSLAEDVTARIAALRAADPDNKEPIPVDLVTASSSGLDPHVSPAAARWQAGRVARIRGIPRERVLALVERFVEGRTFGVLGEPRVNVLRLNLALEDLK